MKHTRKIAFVLVMLLCLGMAGCAQTKDEQMNACRDAVAVLAEQKEIRVLSTTLTGSTEDTMVPAGTWEYWISGEDRLVIAPAGEDGALWSLYMDGKSFKAAEENRSRVWEAVQEDANTDSWVPPEVDIGEYRLETRKDADGRTVVTLTGDRTDTREGTYGEGMTSGYRVEYVLREDGSLAGYSLYYTDCYPNAEGEMETVYWCMVLEYPEFEPGEITAYLDELYEEAVN